MPATLYPRINPTTSDPRTGEPRSPLRIPGTPGYTQNDDVVITSADATLGAAAMVTVTAGAPVPDAPGRLLPFRLEDASGPIHLRIAFLNDPTAAGSSLTLPSDLRVALVPAREIPSPGSVTLDGSSIEGLCDMLKVGDSLSAKPVPGAYAQIRGAAPTGAHGNVLPLTLSFTGPVPAGAVNATWFLVIKSASDVWATFAVSEDASDLADVTELPWIHVPSTDASVDLGGPFTPGIPTTGGTAGTVSNVRNFGPGALAVGASTVTDPSGMDQVSIVPTTIPAAGSGSIGLDFSAADGVTALPVDVGSDDPNLFVGDYHNARLSVTATAEVIGLADTVLVLDASGSMLLRPDGLGLGSAGNDDPAQRRRWDNLVTAVNHLADGYVSFLTDVASPNSRLGVAIFPDVLGKATPGWPGRAVTLVPSAPVSTGGLRTTIYDALVSVGLEVEGAALTPIGEGIAVAMGATSGSTGMFHADAAQHRRWMVLMTDGAHNAGTIHPNQFFLPDAVPDFEDKAVRMYSIGYTTAAGGTAVDLLQDLADNALNPVGDGGLEESQFALAPPTVGFEKDLTDTFLDAMATTLGLAPTFDPPGILTAAAPIAIHEFHVSPFDTGVGIFVDWRTRSRERIQVALISPRCERFDQAALEQRDEFGFRGLEAYAHAYISRTALEGDQPDKSRYGTWKLELRLVSGPQIESHAFAQVPAEPYKFNVFNRSGLRLDVVGTRSRWSTGQPIELVARLRAHGAPVPGARVVGTVTAPTADYGSLLAGAEVDSAVFETTARTIREAMPEVFGMWAAKAQAIAAQHGPIQVSRAHREIVFHETTPGVYRAEVAPTSLSGEYSIHVVASGHAGEVPFRRERAFTANVEARPHPDHTGITYALAENDRLVVVVRPRDGHGNTVIFDPSVSPRLGIDVRGAKASTDVINQFDGTYTRTFALPGSGNPEVVVTYDGDVVADPRPAPDPGVLDWMEKLVDFEAGECDAGKADDPKQALGPVKGPGDPFVGIGAGGHIVLAGRHPFHASHIAVFTHRESTQPYRVFLRPVRAKHWVPIGTSTGPTQVFDVPRRLGPIRSVMVLHARKKHTDCVLLQGVGYTRQRRPKCGSK